MHKEYPGKLGTCPAMLRLQYAYKLKLGMKVFYQEIKPRFEEGIIEDIHYDEEGNPTWIRLSKV
jgi:hypothetical protein